MFPLKKDKTFSLHLITYFWTVSYVLLCVCHCFYNCTSVITQDNSIKVFVQARLNWWASVGHLPYLLSSIEHKPKLTIHYRNWNKSQVSYRNSVSEPNENIWSKAFDLILSLLLFLLSFFLKNLYFYWRKLLEMWLTSTVDLSFYKIVIQMNL